MSTLFNIFLILLNIGFYLILFTFMLRLLFQLFNANSNNPVVLAITNVTNYAVLPLRDYIPKTRYIDLSTLLCWFIVDILKYTLIVYLSAHDFLTFFEYISIIPADFAMQALSLIFYSTLFYTVINFVAPGLQSAGMDTIRALSEPALAVVRKKIPPSGGFDFAPMVVLLGTKFAQVSITQFIPASYFY